MWTWNIGSLTYLTGLFYRLLKYGSTLNIVEHIKLVVEVVATCLLDFLQNSNDLQAGLPIIAYPKLVLYLLWNRKLHIRRIL